MQTRTLGWGLLAILCWGLLPTVAGGALSEWVLTGAFIASSLVFACLPPLMGLPPAPEPEAARTRWRGRLLGLWGLFFFHAFYFEAIQRAPIVEAILINYLWPLFIVLLAWVVLRESFRPAIAVGALLGAGGAALVVGGQAAAFESRHALGYGFALASATAWSSYTVLSRKWGAGRGFLLPASILSAVLSFFWLLGAGWPEAPGPAAWVGIVYLGAIAVGVAILAWERAVSGGQVALLGALSYLAPFLSAFFLWMILGKPIGGFTAAGMVSIVAGGVVAARWRHRG